MLDLRKQCFALVAVTLPALLFAWSYPARAQTLKTIRERDMLNCGVSQGLLGFSSMDDKNAWTGFDVDLCRAMAAVIFDDPAKVAFIPLDAGARFPALQSNKIDVLTSDVSQLSAERLKLAAPDNHIILPEVISKEPLGQQYDRVMISGSTWSSGCFIH